MQYSRISRKFSQTSFFIALLLHLLFLMTFSTVWLLQPTEQHKMPNDEPIPSYVYHGSIQPQAATTPSDSGAAPQALRPDKA